ncbi:gamma-tubulin complex component 2 homolog isoform X2 [Condylostylus longicornis]|uniref:gamma-tubulin complex component 2 homolog isoform X2 n=1 Tax=Condylostylus longicornis TaxID=2530218 RepID=UPI00244DBD56|nr:gamma-tubulin complex component 2 homolog isoform X2 [Condylostylus longicornis]
MAKGLETLKRLMNESKFVNENSTPENIFHTFQKAKDKTYHTKLVTIIKILSKNQPNGKEHLAEFCELLERKPPMYCLFNFLNHYSETKITSPSIVSSSKQVEVSKISTPNVSNIKERIVQAASSTITKNSTGEQFGLGYTFASSNKNQTDTVLWEMPKLDVLQFQQINISAVPKVSQETLLLYDLIYCLSGMQGTYIVPEETIEGDKVEIRFKVSDQIDSSLRNLAQEILPLASYFLCVQKFILEASVLDCGQVLQALGAALRALSNDYYLLLSQLESELSNGNLTLYNLYYYTRPTFDAMEVIAGVLSEIIMNKLKGGRVLTLLYDKINCLTGREDSQKILISLTQSVSVPYMDILQLWIQKGVINDPQQEFLVEDNEVIRREELPENYSADYWEKRYTLRRERIPSFLEKVSDVILRTGKYLNVIRQCGKKVTLPQAISLQFSPTNNNYINVIQNAYHFASKNLLEVLLKENDLMGHLMSVKRYLLLYQGDFITQFMDACEDELAKNVDKVLPMKLENLLGLTLRLSSAKNDPYKDDWHCELLINDLDTQITKIMIKKEDYWKSHDSLNLVGLECFAFRYEVKWPVSLVLNHIAISKYQMLFRQLFYCKHVERQLCKIWKENSSAKKFPSSVAEQYRSAFTLRQRMMNAVQNIEYYMMIEVIEPNWHVFIEKMNNVENVDEVLNVHQDFLDQCIRNCMLTYPHVLRSIIKLCKICLNFCEFIQTESSLAPSDTFSERVKRFDLEFTGLLIGLLKQINEVATENSADRCINLVHRINFNSFYNEQMEKLCAKDAMPSHH